LIKTVFPAVSVSQLSGVRETAEAVADMLRRERAVNFMMMVREFF
jgi:hypothetical protein